MNDHTPAKNRRLIQAGGLLVVALVGLQVWLSQPQHPRAVTLGDGTILKVELIEHGQTSQFRTAPPWWMEFKERLKPEWGKRLPGVRAKTVTKGERDTLTIWFSRFPPKANRFVDADLDSQCTGILDTDGFHYSPTGNLGKPDGVPWIWSQSFANFPRRLTEFRFVGAVGTNRFELMLPNPARTNPPPWQAEALPAWRTNSEVVVRLNEVRVSPFNKHRRSGWAQLQPRLDFFAEGHGRFGWFDTEAKYADPTGNRSWGLSFTEPVQQLDLRVYSSADSPLATNRGLRFALPRVPGAGEFAMFTNGAMFGSARVDSVLLTGPGRFDIAGTTVHSRGPWTATSQTEIDHHRLALPSTNVCVTGSGLFISKMRVLVFVRDAQGQTSRATHWNHWENGAQMNFTIHATNLPPPLELFVIPQEPMEFSFRFATPPPPELKRK